MIPVLAKVAIAIGTSLVSLGIGYFGAAVYYENNPKTLEKTQEIGELKDTIGWKHKHTLLAVNPKESWRIWKHKENGFIELTKNKEPESSLFKELKDKLKSPSEINRLRVTCWSAYKTKSNGIDVDKVEIDMNNYCSY